MSGGGLSSSSVTMGRTSADDPFANFSYHPPKPVGRFRNFGHRSRYKGMSISREQLGSKSSLATLSGSNQNLLDPAKMMSMQEDARSRKISSEVMKHCLYESVLSPSKRRFSMRPGNYCDMTVSEYGDDPSDPHSYARMVQSLPVTPAQSQTVTPLHSPKSSRRFRAFFSCGMTPRNGTPEEDEQSLEVEEDSWKGLPSLFRPRPRYIPASGRAMSTNLLDDMREDMEYVNSDGMGVVLDTPPRGHQYRPNAPS